MAALSDAPVTRLVDLRHLRAHDLGAVLAEETELWANTLDWDFRGSSGLVHRFLEMQALSGYALMVNGAAIGYSYYVCEERKGLIGDLYVLKEYATAENESELLSAIISSLMETAFVRRIESQLMMLRHGSRVPLLHWRYLHVYNRLFLEADLSHAARMPVRTAEGVVFDNWSERRQEEAATLIAAAYRGHIDSEINDQYRSPAGARKFLVNIVQYPGCGTFFPGGSAVAVSGGNGKLLGMVLASLVAPDVGHITQICVLPGLRGQGIGYELLRRSMNSLRQAGCRKVSLTVTASNAKAVELYRSIGFQQIRDFSAFVWEGF